MWRLLTFALVGAIVWVEVLLTFDFPECADRVRCHGAVKVFIQGGSRCSEPCGPGVRLRATVTLCVNMTTYEVLSMCYRQLGYKPCYHCPCEGGPTVNGTWSEWNEWSSPPCMPCPACCGVGQLPQMRIRLCNSPPPFIDCEGKRREFRFVNCYRGPCPVDGHWGAWSPVVNGTCSANCDGGERNQTRTRTCNHPLPAYNGSDCEEGDGEETEGVSCNDQTCAAGDEWSGWTVVSSGACSVTCGCGQQSQRRIRTCESRNCSGDGEETRMVPCNDRPCPVDGQWGSWVIVEHSSCSVTCGTGQQNQTRTRCCSNPAPDHGGRYCEGESELTGIQPCETGTFCPVDGQWGEWINVTCGDAEQNRIRTRQCNNPAPAHGGKDCVGSSQQSLPLACDGQSCPASGTAADCSWVVLGSMLGALAVLLGVMTCLVCNACFRKPKDTAIRRISQSRLRESAPRRAPVRTRVQPTRNILGARYPIEPMGVSSELALPSHQRQWGDIRSIY